MALHNNKKTRILFTYDVGKYMCIYCQMDVYVYYTNTCTHLCTIGYTFDDLYRIIVCNTAIFIWVCKNSLCYVLNGQEIHIPITTNTYRILNKCLGQICTLFCVDCYECNGTSILLQNEPPRGIQRSKITIAL